ncbi:MAG: hypothetical protein HY033_08540 [Ignavibacteriae bacterium]|nr:hypothetical protein [Ignavibacteria bacterium]MBI3364940.1 hypothetical protein [Ignavibacteriota bacterium]
MRGMNETSRGKYGSAGERELFLLTFRRHALTCFPMFRAVREANKRNKGVTRATFRSALMSERIFCGCACAR